MKHAKPDSNEVSPVRILKTGTCPSLSGKSTLTYHIGRNAESEILFRVTANTGGGFFNDEWISFTAIEGVFDQQPKDKPIVSLMLYPLFQGRSMNSPAFLLAVLKAEGLVKSLDDKKRGYERIDSAEFKMLMSSAAGLAVDAEQAAESASQQAKSGKKSTSKSNLPEPVVPTS
ncbi:MAG: hypothetical protein KGN35_07025 [Betaproteobacteria bacterium]|nr:hypothetical protein [Betaproteobacteria bacterium]